uniref:Uncharacterized protein n=1 Tax=Anguilla anguilla TaxID=7936 RepID=A0A0E9PC11_ANGAN
MCGCAELLVTVSTEMVHYQGMCRPAVVLERDFTGWLVMVAQLPDD